MYISFWYSHTYTFCIPRQLDVQVTQAERERKNEKELTYMCVRIELEIYDLNTSAQTISHKSQTVLYMSQIHKSDISTLIL